MASEFKGKNKLKTPKPSSCVKLHPDGISENIDVCFHDSDWVQLIQKGNVVHLDMPGFVQHNLAILMLDQAKCNDAVNSFATEILHLLDKNPRNHDVEIKGTVFVNNYNNAGERVDFKLNDLFMLMQIGYMVKEKNERRIAQAYLPF